MIRVFHIPLHTSTYLHEHHKLLDASTRLTLALTLSCSYLRVSWPTAMEVHGSSLLLPRKLESYLQASMEVDVSRWKVSWK